jgi:ribosome-associated toxin RatA of RatAB toxin-antitoxin module
MAAFTALIAALTTPPAVVAAAPGGTVDVAEREGVYHITARFEVPHAPDAARAVLTDYERIPRILPDVRSSIVRERDGDRVIVEQEAVSRLLFFSRRVHLRLEVHERDDRIRFRDLCGKSFVEYEGGWRFRALEDEPGTLVEYELAARPAFSVPEWMLKRLLRNDAREMIERLRKAIAARADALAGARDSSPD